MTMLTQHPSLAGRQTMAPHERLTFDQVEALLRQMPLLRAQQACALDPARRTEAAYTVERLTEAISFLPAPCSQVLQILYIEQCTWIQAETRLFMARNTLARYRRKGVELLRQMLNGPQNGLPRVRE